MNMFVKARDLQNELFLNTVSWVEFMKPKYCVLKNVFGFIKYCPLAEQVSRHQVEGGIERGGVKFVVRALLMLGYELCQRVTNSIEPDNL